MLITVFNYTRTIVNVFQFYPSRHKKLKQCWLTAGPPSTTLDQHSTDIDSTSCACWDMCCIHCIFVQPALFGLCQ